MIDERGGADDEDGERRIGLRQRGDERDGLMRLAEAHVVAEQAAEAVLLQEPQPLIAGLLIRVQIESERRGRRRVGVGLDLVEEAEDALARGVAAEDGLAAQRAADAQQLELRDEHVPARTDGRVVEPRELRIGDVDPEVAADERADAVAARAGDVGRGDGVVVALEGDARSRGESSIAARRSRR